MKFSEDIVSCYNSNKFVFDSQNSICCTSEGLIAFLKTFTESPDSIVVGLFDDNYNFLYGLVIFDNIRFDGKGVKSVAEVHIAVDRSAFGKLTFKLLEDLRDECSFTTLFCHIPDIANRAIGLCKKLGFKKTGYIPNCLPYINLKGEEKLHDVQIWTYNKPSNEDILLKKEEIPF